MRENYTAKLLFHQSPARHSDWTVMVLSPLLTVDSTVTTVDHCVVTVLLAVVNRWLMIWIWALMCTCLSRLKLLSWEGKRTIVLSDNTTTNTLDMALLNSPWKWVCCFISYALILPGYVVINSTCIHAKECIQFYIQNNAKKSGILLLLSAIELCTYLISSIYTTLM